jgi:hypothetical protein
MVKGTRDPCSERMQRWCLVDLSLDPLCASNATLTERRGHWLRIRHKFSHRTWMCFRVRGPTHYADYALTRNQTSGAKAWLKPNIFSILYGPTKVVP